MENNSEDFRILLNAAFDVSQIKDQLNNIKGLSVKIGVDTAGIKQSIQNAINEATKGIPNINIGTSSVNNRSGTGAANLNATAKQIERIQSALNNGRYTFYINELETGFKRMGVSAQEAAAKVQGIRSAYEAMKGASGAEQLVAAQKAFNLELSTGQNQLRQMRIEASEVSDALKTAKLSNDITDKLNKNTAMTRKAKEELRAYVDLLNGGTKSSGERQAIQQRVNAIMTEQRAMGRLGGSWTDTFQKGAKKFAEWTISSGAIVQSVQAVRNVITNVKELDTEMTELLKVSDATGAELQTAFSRSIESAKEFGASVRDVISATADWSRLGYSLPDSEELARIATLYKNVGDGIDIDTANKSLVSTLQGFQLEAKDALSIIDKFNEVANNFPIDTAGIGEALQNSAAAFNAANTDLSKSIALITGTNSVVQDPSSVGNMWKTVSMRIRGATAELENAGEDTEGMVQSTAELQALVKGITGFDIMEDANTFKDIYDIVIGIGEAWKDLKDIDQAALLEALAGKRQGNALAAALNNIDMIKEAYGAAEDSAGSAMREQENYEKSIQYSLDRLSASFEAFSSSLLDSGVLKFFLDLGTVGVKALDGITKALTPLGTIGLGVGIFAGIKNNGRDKMFSLCGVIAA